MPNDLNNHQRAFIARARAMPLTENPPGWTHLVTVAVGGLQAVGYIDDLQALLVVSSTGRGLFDCRTGERIARDSDSSIDVWSRFPELTVDGIGPAIGRKIGIAGIDGGGLLRVAEAGWNVEVAWPDWPKGEVILNSPGSMIYIESRASGCYRIAHIDNLVAYGFSPDGKSLVVAESHTLKIWRREPIA